MLVNSMLVNVAHFKWCQTVIYSPFYACKLKTRTKPALRNARVNVMKRKGCGAKIMDPLTGFIIESLGGFFVDDADLFTWQEEFETSVQVWRKMQQDATDWGKTLKASGGALKPPKWFWTLVSYLCDEGEWIPEDCVDYELFIDDLDGTPVKIDHVAMDEAKKTLGIYDSHGGGNTEHLEKLDEKMETWMNRVKNGHLPSHMAWVAY